ncbi:transcriptional repressor [Chlorobaculum limnaeum]|uniref:Transcriptional repressor n=2 Tax=Chlorobaculum limnaeum TaxID=274537 RepID=A0A1D8D732_CHLLM|nr:transcriptional repressor [Chlorobaculum limnaeum]
MDRSEPKEERINRFIENCHQAGLKITPQRLAIYKLLMDCTDHPSADWVYRKITVAWPTISFDTVNRTLLTFAEIGVIDMVESFSPSRRFDSQTEKHHHLHCVKCGQITDVRDSSLDNVPVPAHIDNGFTVTGTRVVISGICAGCAR